MAAVTTSCDDTQRALPGQARGDAGLTLIEIIVTLAVLGIVAYIFIVNLDGLTQSERLRTAARRMAGLSDLVRSQATDARTVCYLDIDFVENRYRWRRDPLQDDLGRFLDGNDGHILSEDELQEWNDSFGWDELPRDVYFRRLYFSSDKYFDSQHKTATVVYWPDGTLMSYTLWLQGAAEDEEQGPYYSVVVNGLSGTSEILDFASTPASATEADFRGVLAEAPGGNSGPGGPAGSPGSSVPSGSSGSSGSPRQDSGR